MIARRDLLIGGACVAAAGVGAALKPRRNVSLLAKNETLANIVPAKFGPWRSEDVGDPMAINGPETLSARLYNQLVSRIYTNDEAGASVFMLLAYGGRQTDELQLHRPEICYPAFGFELLRNEPTNLDLAKGVVIPARRLLADSESRRESIVYWTRMGEYLPSSGGQQREDRFRIAMQGIIPDGLLSRFSTIATGPADAWTELETFVTALVAATPAKHRKVLIGTERADALAAQTKA
ncbi:exosortase-associated protein EpsI, V-type [Phenylobacterium sp.]|uniref:exosortase-associated protein EpsI, V-type n=1 Tax=Phenylobacterium sp. TaxID=1871053 RepID=UPI0025D724D0|nr:exosortase-associated protein EpsI, V-type [Phenylobacterium sp.]